MKRLTVAAFGALLTALVSSGFGCELIASVDRTKIDQGGGGAGGMPTGGTGGMPTGGGGTGGTGGTGGGMPCTTPADCDAPASECIEATCEGNVCGEANKASGTPVAMQTAGDCKVVQCDGAGAIIDADDDADVPVDDNECTDDVCTAGEPSNPPVAAASPCGVDGMLQCDGMGLCVGCLDAIDCGTDTECQAFTCDMTGTCNTVNAAQGTLLAMQTAGDCQVAQCDGMGGEESADDNADLPVDTTTCTDDVCAAGVPSNPPVMANTACMEGAGALCDGNGACVECNAATDCPGMDTECQTRTCEMGVCGFDFAMSGTPLASQTDGDCKQVVCDGAGSTMPANDDADLPDDNNVCTDDTCSAGTPTFTNVMEGTSCGATQVCDANGQCVGCNAPTDCPGTDDECKTRTCAANVCGFSFTAQNTPVTAQTPNDCQQDVCDGAGNVVTQNDDADLPVDDGIECTGQACTNGMPSFPPVAVNTPCTENGGSFCSAAGECVECTGAAQCPGGNECQIATCSGNTCGIGNQPMGTPVAMQTAGDCQENQCDGAGAVMQAESNGDVPVDGLECTADVCTAGVPSNPGVAVDTPCTEGGGAFCDGVDACVECTGAAQCPAGNECQIAACSANTCGFTNQPMGTPVAMQTAGDCKQNQCDGAGNSVPANLDTDVPVDGNQCTDDVCTAGVPTNPNLMAGAACNQSGGTQCDGMGACVGALGCSDGMLNGDETDTDCGGSCGPCANGDTCAVNGDCTSAICSGMICVECAAATDCPGMDNECQARTCTANACGLSFTMAGTPVAMQTAGDCQQNQCDGAGNTVSAADNTDTPADDGTACTDQTCVAGVPTFPPTAVDTACNDGGGSFCDGAGACVQCNDAGQCPAGDECKTPVCAGNACGFSFTMAGTAVTMQTTGDCQQNECDGAGNTVSAADDADLPADDGNECTDQECLNGVPDFPAFPAGTTCNQMGGTECDGAGTCVSAPGVATTTPADGAGSITTATTLAVTFTKAMNPATLTAQTAVGACSGSIQVSSDNFASCIGFSAAAPTMSVGDTIATLTPAPALSFGTTYQIKVLASAADTMGATIGADVTTPAGFGTGTDFVSGSSVVISQAYAGGGNSGAQYTHDFIELQNRGPSSVDIGGWAVQFTNATGTAWAVHAIPAGTMLTAGSYYLIEEAAGAGGNGVALPAPDLTGGTFAMGATSGKVILTNDATALAGACPTSAAIVDVVGYGTTANCFEGAGPTPAPSNTTSVQRANVGCRDAGSNQSDFAALAPAPRSSTSAPAVVCSVSVNEKNVATELDYCNLQFPTSIDVQSGMLTAMIYAQAYEAGVTDPVGAAAGLVAEIGYGPTTVNPESQSGWTWAAATFNIDAGNNDEWQAQLTAPATGTYRYTARFSFDGVQWTYCDLNGAGSDAGLTFEVGQLPTMTVSQ